MVGSLFASRVMYRTIVLCRIRPVGAFICNIKLVSYTTYNLKLKIHSHDHYPCVGEVHGCDNGGKHTYGLLLIIYRINLMKKSLHEHLEQYYS